MHAVILTQITWELKKLGHDVHLGARGVSVATRGWKFYVNSDGRLRGCDLEGNDAATLSTVPCAESIHKFLTEREPIGEIK